MTRRDLKPALRADRFCRDDGNPVSSGRPS
jgi:hypothetical protein